MALRRQKPLPPLAGRQFSHLKDISQEVRRIVHIGPRRLAGDDAALIGAWLEHHYQFDAILARHGAMVSIDVRHNPAVPGRERAIEDKYQTWPTFADGFASELSFQEKRSLFGYTEEDSRQRQQIICLDRLREVLRDLISGDVEEHKAAVYHGTGVCEHSGARLAWEETDVHHAQPSFEWLAFQFLLGWTQHHAITVLEIGLVQLNTAGKRTFADERITEAWLQYHLQSWRPLVVTKAAHREIHGARPDEVPPWGRLFAPLPAVALPVEPLPAAPAVPESVRAWNRRQHEGVDWAAHGWPPPAEVSPYWA
jgi:hypothetical protein